MWTSGATIVSMRGDRDAWIARIGEAAYRRSQQADKFAYACIAATVIAFAGLALPGHMVSGVVAASGLCVFLITLAISAGLTVSLQRAACRHNGLPVSARWSMAPHNRWNIGRRALRDPASFDAWLADQKAKRNQDGQ